MKRMKCYIYTRVSTSMQVDGYSLDAQKDKLRKYAEFQNMLVAGEYCDEGKSGKNIEGRPEFLRMLRDIESGKDGVSFVLVFKLSRFGRNAADVLTSLQRMQDFGVNLICVEDGIDSSKDSGKLMISVLSAVAEIERENILVQTMEGRRQKAREGKWNGGFAPYGYKLVDGQLQIAEEEAEVIRIIYDKYIHTTMGTARIANWLNEHGYSKICRHNNKREAFTGSFLIGVLDNPVYCGKLAYGRRHNEKIPGTRNQYHIVKQKDYTLYDGIHEPIISEEDWQLAQLHPNISAQYFYQAALTCMELQRPERALEYLRRFADTVAALLWGAPILHGDAFFDRLEPWIARMELGGDAPRRLRLAAQDAVRALRHPAFAPLRADAAFAALEKNLQEEANHAEN